MSDLISIIIPFFCTPKELFQRCIESVLIKGADNIEVIVVDDGSPKEYREILCGIQDKRVRIFFLPHLGVSVARNRGIKEAHGQWIMFVDADDYVNHNTMNYIAHNIGDFSGDVELFGGGVDRNGFIIENTTYLKEDYDYGINEEDRVGLMKSALSVGLLPRGYIQGFSLGSPCSKLYRREFLKSNNLFFDENVTFAEDTLFSLHVYRYARHIFYHDRYLYNYYNNTNSTTQRYRPGMSKEMFDFFDKVDAFLCENNRKLYLEEALNMRAWFEAKRCFTNEYFHKSNKSRNRRKEYLKIISKEPFKTALDEQKIYKSDIRSIICRIIIKNGFGIVYTLYKKVLPK